MIKENLEEVVELTTTINLPWPHNTECFTPIRTRIFIHILFAQSTLSPCGESTILQYSGKRNFKQKELLSKHTD